MRIDDVIKVVRDGCGDVHGVLAHGSGNIVNAIFKDDRVVFRSAKDMSRPFFLTDSMLGSENWNIRKSPCNLEAALRQMDMEDGGCFLVSEDNEVKFCDSSEGLSFITDPGSCLTMKHLLGRWRVIRRNPV